MSSSTLSYDFLSPRQIVFGWGRRREIGRHARAIGRRAWIVCGSGTIAQDGALAEIRGMGVGVLVMKALRNLVGTGSGRMSVDQLLQYGWDLDVSTVLVGHERVSELEYNMSLAVSQGTPTALDPEELAWMRRHAKKRRDLLCWLKPGYMKHERRV